MNNIEKDLLLAVADLHQVPSGAYNIRQNGKSIDRNSTKNIEIDINEILKYVISKNIIKLKDKAKTEYDLEKISKEQSLRGIFVKELLEQINEENREQVLESIYIGLNIM